MNSRRRMSAPKLQGDGILPAKTSTLIGGNKHWEHQPLDAANVSIESISDVGPRKRDVRFPPVSDQTADILASLKRAINGSRSISFDYLVSSGHNTVGNG